MINTFIDTAEKRYGVSVDSTVDEVLTRWKKRADEYQYDPSKPIRHYPLGQFMQELRQCL